MHLPSPSELHELQRYLTPQQQRELDRLLTLPTKWEPLKGPQTEALNSPADILLYGGAAGGGKSDLLLGAARNGQTEAIIFRRIYPNLEKLLGRSRQIYDPTGSLARCFRESPVPRWRFDDKTEVRFAAIQHEKDMFDYQGRAYDLHGFDEITEFTEAQFRFVTNWNRSAKPGQRARIVCTCNPPMSGDGDWIISYWAPWLDKNHPRPALPGELRWFTTVDGKDLECPNGEPFERNGEMVLPRSRTFIPAKLQDNPYLMHSMLQVFMASSFTEARKRQLARLGGAKPPAPRAAIALAKSQAYQDAADAPATLRAYATDLANYKAWCDRHRFVAMPATPEVVRTRSIVRPAFFALPLQMRQHKRSTSSTITDFACILPGLSVGNPLAVCAACWIRIAM